MNNTGSRNAVSTGGSTSVSASVITGLVDSSNLSSSSSSLSRSTASALSAALLGTLSADKSKDLFTTSHRYSTQCDDDDDDDDHYHKNRLSKTSNSKIGDSSLELFNVLPNSQSSDSSALVSALINLKSTSNSVSKTFKTHSSISSDVGSFYGVNDNNNNNNNNDNTSTKFSKDQQSMSRCLCTLDRVKLRRDLQKWSKNTLLFVGECAFFIQIEKNSVFLTLAQRWIKSKDKIVVVWRCLFDKKTRKKMKSMISCDFVCSSCLFNLLEDIWINFWFEMHSKQKNFWRALCFSLKTFVHNRRPDSSPKCCLVKTLDLSNQYEMNSSTWTLAHSVCMIRLTTTAIGLLEESAKKVAHLIDLCALRFPIKCTRPASTNLGIKFNALWIMFICMYTKSSVTYATNDFTYRTLKGTRHFLFSHF